jgi:acyl transferase domain-containing protein/phosphopantetheinyl transferase
LADAAVLPAPGSEPVAIVGMACVLPGAPDLATFWSNVVGGVDAITDVPAQRWDPVFYDPEGDAPDRFYCRRGGFVDGVADFDPTEFGIMPLAVEGAEPDQLLALAVAARALADAGDPHRRLDPTRTGVIVGRGGYIGTGVRRLEQRVHTAEQLVMSLRALLPDLDETRLAAVKADFVAQLGPSRPESAIDLVPNLTASRISNRLDLRGPSHTVDAACASSLVAVDQAIDQLASGRCDVVLAGGVHHCHDLTLWSVFTQLGAISRRQELRAFDRAADGLLIGEGTVMLVLERLADAESNGDRVYAVISGSGVASDGRATSLMSPSVTGQVAAVSSAWRRAGRDPAEVGLIEAHGTGTPTGDEVELRTLQQVFGPAGRDRPRAGLGSVKSMIGHAMPAAGAAGIAKAALAVYHGQLPPTLHAEDPSPLVAETKFRLVQETEPWESQGPRLAGVDAFGFGGINAHVVLEEHRPTDAHRRLGRGGPARGARAGHAVPRVNPADPPESPEAVLAVAGASPAEVATHLKSLADLARPLLPVEQIGSGPCRLTIVAPNPKRLALAAEVAQRGRPFSGRNDVWFEPTPLIGDGVGKLAVVFPGLEPDFTPHLDDVAAVVGFDTRRIVTDATGLEILGPAVIDAGRLLHLALERTGVRADLVAGHSVGEWAAQIATGMTPADAIEPVLEALEPGRLRHPDVAYLALGCGVDAATELIAGLDNVVVSHDNCPHQSVVCGTDAAIAAVVTAAKQRRVFAQPMPFRSGFHTPMFRPYLDAMRDLFGVLPVLAPSVPVWSATTLAPYPDDVEAVRALTVDHLTQPVRWRQLVTRLHDHGVRAWVELGAGSLTGFVADTLGDRPHLAVAANSPKRSGLAQLRRTTAALWCAGADLDLGAVAQILTGPAPRRAATATDRSRPLRFGSPLVTTMTPLPRPVPTSTGGPGLSAPADLEATPALVAAYQATVTQATAASEDVIRQWVERGPDRRRSIRRAADRAGRAGATSTIGAAPSPATPERTEMHLRQRWSLADQPAWADHAIFSQPEGWADQRDRFPIVPLTAMIERFIEVASELCPDLVAVGVEDVRATRWLVVEPATTTDVRAAVIARDDGVVTVRTTIDGHARANVLMAATHRPAPRPAPGRAAWDRVLPYPPAAIYSDRWLFHGPAYQGIERITGWDDHSIEGEVTRLAAPGALLDNAGQMLGLWVALALPERRTVLPTTIDRIRLHGPTPPLGAPVRCRATVTAVTEDEVVADLELTGPAGVWAQVEGWVERRFDTTNPVFEMIRSPQDHVVAAITPHGWAWAQETWLDPASREMLMRRYLNSAERDAYQRRNPRAQRATLVGRVALKDLLRHQRWAHGAGPLYPAEITVTNDDTGRPTARGAVDPGVSVSIAHSQGLGVAIAGRGIPVGIDIEAIGERSPRFAALVLAEGERAVLEEMPGSLDQRLTTVWTLKEAAAKASGVGLQGRPKAWEIAEHRAGRYRIGTQWLATDRLAADSSSAGSLAADSSSANHPSRTEYVVAWTIPPN